MKRMRPSHLLLAALVLAVFAWSAVAPHDRFTWWLEVTPAVVALAVLAAIYRKFR